MGSIDDATPADWNAVSMAVKDAVDHPPHYNKYGVECIDALRAATGEGFEYYLQGNVMKYLWRYRYKNGIEDLKKANWYLELLIAEKQDNES